MMNATFEDQRSGRRPLRLAIMWALAALLAPAVATAASWTEVGDAGQTLATAQIITGTTGASLDSITGTLNVLADHDLFLIYIPVGSAFSATTVGTPGNISDTQLFLFDRNGRGVYANDDDPAGAGTSASRSTLPKNNALSPTTAGFYYLLIDDNGSYPISGAAGTSIIFPNFTTVTGAEKLVVGPTGAGGGAPLLNYTGTGTETGNYTIVLTGAIILPEPGSLILLLCSSPFLLTFAVLRRRSRPAGACG